MPPPDLVDFLTQTELFRGVTDAAIRDIASAVRTATLRDGEVLIRQDDFDRHLYLVVAGRLRVRGGRPGTMSGCCRTRSGARQSARWRCCPTIPRLRPSMPQVRPRSPSWTGRPSIGFRRCTPRTPCRSSSFSAAACNTIGSPSRCTSAISSIRSIRTWCAIWNQSSICSCCTAARCCSGKATRVTTSASSSTVACV